MPEHPPSPFFPLDAEHARFFRRTTALSKEHWRVVKLKGADHHPWSFELCGTCDAIANHALEIAARRCRRNGRDRDEALAWLSGTDAEHDAGGRPIDAPAAFGARTCERLVRDALRSLYPHRLAHRNAVRSSHYGTALERARAAGALSVSVASALNLLGLISQAVQDPASPVDPGQPVHWAKIEETLAASPWRECTIVGVEQVWQEVQEACIAHPPAATMLERNVLSRSQNTNGATAPMFEHRDGRNEDPVARAADPQAATDEGPSRLDRAVDAAARRLAGGTSLGTAQLRRELWRALRAEFGDAEHEARRDELLDALLPRLQQAMGLLDQPAGGDGSVR